jgi:hypothetical protein
MGGTASTKGSSSLQSWTLAADRRPPAGCPAGPRAGDSCCLPCRDRRDWGLPPRRRLWHARWCCPGWPVSSRSRRGPRASSAAFGGPRPRPARLATGAAGASMSLHYRSPAAGAGHASAARGGGTKRMPASRSIRDARRATSDGRPLRRQPQPHRLPEVHVDQFFLLPPIGFTHARARPEELALGSAHAPGTRP